MPAFWRTLAPGGATFRRDPTVAHRGSASPLIEGSGAVQTGDDPCWAAEPLVTPRPGGSAELAAWVRGAAATGRTYVDLVWLDWQGQQIADEPSSLLPVGDSPWTRLVSAGAVPDGAVAAQLRLCSAANSGSAWFDDVSLETR